MANSHSYADNRPPLRHHHHASKNHCHVSWLHWPKRCASLCNTPVPSMRCYDQWPPWGLQSWIPPWDQLIWQLSGLICTPHHHHHHSLTHPPPSSSLYMISYLGGHLSAIPLAVTSKMRWLCIIQGRSRINSGRIVFK